MSASLSYSPMKKHAEFAIDFVIVGLVIFLWPFALVLAIVGRVLFGLVCGVVYAWDRLEDYA